MNDNIIDRMVGDAAAAMARKKEDEFRDVLDAAFPTGWTHDMIRRRCSLVRYVGSPVETLCVDGKPVLEIHPLQFEQVQTETGWVMKVTQNYRRIPSARTT